MVRVSERVEHVALDRRRKELLLIVLAVNIAQMRRQVAQQRRSGGAIGDEGSRLAVREDFTLDQKFVVFDFDAGIGEKSGRGGELEYAGDAGALGAGADHFGGGSTAEEKIERVDHDGFAAARFTGKQVQAAME